MNQNTGAFIRYLLLQTPVFVNDEAIKNLRFCSVSEAVIKPQKR